MELPSTIRELIDTLMRTNVLNGWNIYSEKGGGMTVKLKFGVASHVGETSQAWPAQISYVKKPAGKIKRDNNRLSEHKSKIQTRSSVKADLQPEVARVGSESDFMFGGMISDSPAQVVSECLSTPVMSPLIEQSPKSDPIAACHMTEHDVTTNVNTSSPGDIFIPLNGSTCSMSESHSLNFVGQGHDSESVTKPELDTSFDSQLSESENKCIHTEGCPGVRFRRRPNRLSSSSSSGQHGYIIQCNVCLRKTFEKPDT